MATLQFKMQLIRGLKNKKSIISLLIRLNGLTMYHAMELKTNCYQYEYEEKYEKG